MESVLNDVLNKCQVLIQGDKVCHLRYVHTGDQDKQENHRIVIISFNSSLTLAWCIVYLTTVQLQKYIWSS